MSLRFLFSPRSLLPISLASLLALSLVGCDTSGSSEEEENNSSGPDFTFTVSVAQKTDAHPNQGKGNAAGFVVDGEQGRELTLTRGTEYTFQMNDVPPTHPFYLSTSDVGAGAEEYADGVSGNFATGNETLTFTPNADTPDLLYYQCGNHRYMGWRINVTDAENGDDGGSDGNGDDGGNY